MGETCCCGHEMCEHEESFSNNPGACEVEGCPCINYDWDGQ